MTEEDTIEMFLSQIEQLIKENQRLEMEKAEMANKLAEANAEQLVKANQKLKEEKAELERQLAEADYVLHHAAIRSTLHPTSKTE